MKTAVSNLIFASALGIPLIVIAVMSPGLYAGKLFQSGLIMIFIGLVTSLYFFVKGKKADKDYNDERSNYIFEKSAKFTFYIAAVAIQISWAYNFAIAGNKGDNIFILLAVFWGSFLTALIYNTIKS